MGWKLWRKVEKEFDRATHRLDRAQRRARKRVDAELGRWDKQYRGWRDTELGMLVHQIGIGIVPIAGPYLAAGYGAARTARLVRKQKKAGERAWAEYQDWLNQQGALEREAARQQRIKQGQRSAFAQASRREQQKRAAFARTVRAHNQRIPVSSEPVLAPQRATAVRPLPIFPIAVGLGAVALLAGSR